MKELNVRDENEKIIALFSPNGYTMDFQRLSELFMEKSAGKKNDIDVYLGKKVEKIEKFDNGFELIILLFVPLTQIVILSILSSIFIITKKIKTFKYKHHNNIKIKWLTQIKN